MSRPYEVPSYVYEDKHARAKVRGAHVGAVAHLGAHHVGAIEAKEVLNILTKSPLMGERKYEVPAYVAGYGFTHIGADASSTDATKTAPTSKEMTPSGPALDEGKLLGISLAMVAGLIVVGFVIELGGGYIVYKMSKSTPLAAVIGFFTGGPVGLIGAYVGAGMAAKKMAA